MINKTTKPTATTNHLQGNFNPSSGHENIYSISSRLLPCEQMDGNRLSKDLAQSLMPTTRHDTNSQNKAKHRITDEQRLGVLFMQHVYDRTDYCDSEILDIAPYIVKMATKLCSIKDGLAPTHGSIDTMLRLNRIKHKDDPLFINMLERATKALHEYLAYAHGRFARQHLRPLNQVMLPMLMAG